MQPVIVVTNSCPSISPDHIIKNILDVEELPEPLTVLPDIRGYSWHIDTKYYEADVQVCCLENKSIGTQEFAELVNAVVIPFDSFQKDALNTVNQWFTFVKEFHAEVCILVTDHFNNEATGDLSPNSPLSCVSKLDAQNWCVSNGFELVELTPNDQRSDSDLEDDFVESNGIKRIVQALHAHMWPNLELKNSRNNINSTPRGLQNALLGLGNTSTMDDPMIVDEVSDNGGSDAMGSINERKKLVAQVKPITKSIASDQEHARVAIVSPTILHNNTDASASTSDGAQANSSSSLPAAPNISPVLNPSPSRDDRLDSMMHAIDNMSEDSFEALFQNLSEMKSKAENLSPNDRRAYAERMAIAFWKSLGGNDSEVEGLSDDDN